MPSYDFKCNQCHAKLTLHYRTFKAYDAAIPTCSECGSTDLTRTITSVTIAKGRTHHDYTRMNATEMLSVFESGDSKAVGEMMKQVGDTAPAGQLGENYANAADRLSSGASMNSVERDLRNGNLGKSADEGASKGSTD